ncbi:retrovirus-related Pol polyprotein from transposon 17.6 [Trichonephila clavipes]|nr:retrovirus-related Pol polyprotein from transposon 17.6 [Trichonephila clavipes]
MFKRSSRKFNPIDSRNHKENLLNEFPDRINSAQLHNRMQARRLKPTETLQEYFLAKRDLAHTGAVGDYSLIDYIIDGIFDSSNNKIILYGSKTLSKSKDKLKIYETLLNSKHSKKFPNKRFRDYENSTLISIELNSSALQNNNQFVTSVG